MHKRSFYLGPTYWFSTRMGTYLVDEEMIDYEKLLGTLKFIGHQTERDDVDIIVNLHFRGDKSDMVMIVSEMSNCIFFQKLKGTQDD